MSLQDAGAFLDTVLPYFVYVDCFIQLTPRPYWQLEIHPRSFEHLVAGCEASAPLAPHRPRGRVANGRGETKKVAP